MCQKGDTVIMELPANIDAGKENRTIAADKCCVEVLEYLWAHNIDTRGHCCGHGKAKPSVIISEDYKFFGAHVELLIADIDKRQWDVLQWQLVKANL